MNGVVNQYSGGADKGIEDGVFIDLLDYLEEYAPHYYNIISTDPDLYEDVTTPRVQWPASTASMQSPGSTTWAM